MAQSDVMSSPRVPARRGMAALARVADIVVDPPAAFRDIDTQPSWGVAFLAIVGLRFASLIAFYHPDTTPAKLLAGVLYQVTTTFPLIAVIATLLWASALCVTTHVAFAYTLCTVAIASVAGAMLPDSVQVELRHPPFTNLAYLTDANESPAWHALAAAADVRSLYALGLAWVGVRSASKATALAAAAVLATCFAIALVGSVASAATR
jgi:hypothetical protein